MKIKYILSAMLLSAVVSGVNAQETYSLSDCERMAIENNRKLQNAKLSVEARARLARRFYQLFPRNFRYGRMVQCQSRIGTYRYIDRRDVASRSGYDAATRIIGCDTGLRTRLFAQNGIVGGVTATMPVFAGGRIVNGNKLAKVGEEAANLQQVLTEDEIVLTTNTYFWQVVNLQEKLETVRSIQEMLDRLQKDVEAAVDAGMTTRNDLLRVRLQIQDVASTRLKIENGIAVCKMQLAQFIGTDVDDFELQYTTSEICERPLAMYCDPREVAMNRTEAGLLDLNVRAAKLKRRIAFGEQLPSIGFGGGYLYNDLLGKSNNSGIIYASVSIPISGWWKGSHTHKRHRILERQAENDRTDKIELMTVETKQIWNELVEAYEQLLLAKTSIGQATENMRIVENTYKAGTVPLTELLDAQVLFRQSHNQYSDAYSVYRIKELKYRQITANTTGL